MVIEYRSSEEGEVSRGFSMQKILFNGLNEVTE